MGKTLIRHLLLPVISALALGQAFVSCNTAGCTENRSSIPQAEFYSSATEKPISLDSLQIVGVGAPGDSVLLKPGHATGSVYLPMRSSKKSTAWCFSYKWKELDNPALNDTITFDYDSQPWFASEECGAMYRYRIHRIRWTSHLVDSVACTDSLISNTNAVQLRIYFRTSENPVE